MLRDFGQKDGRAGREGVGGGVRGVFVWGWGFGGGGGVWRAVESSGSHRILTLPLPE